MPTSQESHKNQVNVCKALALGNVYEVVDSPLWSPPSRTCRIAQSRPASSNPQAFSKSLWSSCYESESGNPVLSEKQQGSSHGACKEPSECHMDVQ